MSMNAQEQNAFDCIVSRVNELETKLLKLSKEVDAGLRNASVEIPVVDEQGNAIKDERYPCLHFGLVEKRHITDVVRWLEDLLDVKFQIVRRQDEEGAYDNS